MNFVATCYHLKGDGSARYNCCVGARCCGSMYIRKHSISSACNHPYALRSHLGAECGSIALLNPCSRNNAPQHSNHTVRSTLSLTYKIRALSHQRSYQRCREIKLKRSKLSSYVFTSAPRILSPLILKQTSSSSTDPMHLPPDLIPSDSYTGIVGDRATTSANRLLAEVSTDQHGWQIRH